MTEQMTLDGRYTVLEEIGHGGFGITYKAVNKNNDQLTAIKSFRDTSKERILREARILKDFSDDPAIVSVLDYFEDDTKAYIVMEYLEGSKVREHILKDGKWSMEKTVRAFTPVMNALIKVHASGLIHGDISPDNLMILADGTMKLIDFGSAKHFEQNTMTLSGVYKSGYSPPEHIEGNGKTGPYTDVYSLCATMYFCITGSDPEDVLSRLLFDELEVPSRLGAEILPPAEKCLMKGLTLESGDRIQSVGELLNTLLKYYPDLTEEEKRATALKKKKRKKILASAFSGALLIVAALVFHYRIPILFRYIETERVYYDGSGMTEEAFQKNAQIVKARTEAFSDGRYLWKEEGQGINVRLPYRSLHDENPQNLLRTVLTRPMVMSVITTEQDNEETDYGIFSQTEDVESVKREEDLVLRFTEKASERLDGLLDEKDKNLTLSFDKEENYQYPLTIEARTLGDGSSIIISPAQDYLPDELWQQLLTKAPLDQAFLLDSEWKVQWEKVEDALFPGKNQVNADSFDSKTVCFRYRPYDDGKTVEGYDASEVSFQAILKNRLDSIGIPYAIGRSVHEPEKILVRFKPEGIRREEIENLGTAVFLKLGSDVAISNEYLPDRFEIKEAGNTYTLTMPISEGNFSDMEEALETILSQNKERAYLYESSYQFPLASTDAAQALQTLKDTNTISFDVWDNNRDIQNINSENVHLGRFLTAAAVQTPQKPYYLDSAQVLNRDGTKAFTEDITEYIPEVESELPEGIEEEWKEKYGGILTRYICDERYIALSFFQKDIEDPKSALEDFILFYRENKEILDSSHIRSMFVSFYAEKAEEEKEQGIGLSLNTEFETGERLINSGYIESSDESGKEELIKKYNEYINSAPEFAEIINKDKAVSFS